MWRRESVVLALLMALPLGASAADSAAQADGWITHPQRPASPVVLVFRREVGLHRGRRWFGQARIKPDPENASDSYAKWDLIHLFFITLMPFSTQIVGRYEFAPAVWLYAANITFAALAAIRLTYLAEAESGKSDPDSGRPELGLLVASAIAVPLLIDTYGGNPAAIGAIGMLAGFCGTLMTPLAANFNIVPVRLLELRDPNAVVKAQIPTALPLLLINILLIYFLAF